MTEPQSIARDLAAWVRAWREHDLAGVLLLVHENVRLEHWDGRLILGKAALRRAWSDWFAGRDFQFVEEETFVDAPAQRALFRWRLTWPSALPGWQGEKEERRGVDVLHFQDGLIVRKLTYCQTTVTIGGRRMPLAAQPPG